MLNDRTANGSTCHLDFFKAFFKCRHFLRVAAWAPDLNFATILAFGLTNYLSYYTIGRNMQEILTSN